MALVGLGGLLLFSQMLGYDFWSMAWPLFVIMPGAFLFLMVKEMGKRAAGLTIPASMITALGLLLLYQNTVNHWESWAYAWTLIFPTALGLGLTFYGDLARKPGTVKVGERMAQVGLGMFVVGAIFFEALLNISGMMTDLGILIPVLLVAAGFYFLRRKERPSAGQSPYRERPVYELDDSPWMTETPIHEPSDDRRPVRS